MFGSSQGLNMGFASSGGVFSASQGGAFSGSAQVSQSQDPASKRGGRSDDKQTCLPVTVRSVLDAVDEQHNHGSDEISIHGSVPGQVVLVGTVEGLMKQAASMQFTLNDATGRIGVRYYMSEDSNGNIDKVEPGRYVSIVGSLRTSPAVHVSVLRMRPIESADEISYHMIEAAYSFLRLSKTAASIHGSVEAMSPLRKSTPPVSSQGDASQLRERSAFDTLTPPKTDAKHTDSLLSGFASAQVNALPSVADLRPQLVKVLQCEGEGKGEGVKLDVLLQRFGKASPNDIRKVLEQLVEDGDVYNTIDDEHFAVV